MNTDKLPEFKNRFPLLEGVIARLNEHNIDWLIGGSGCLFLLGNDRLPDDVDIYLRADQHDLADEIFGIESFVYTSPQENVRNSNPEGSHSMQLTSGLKITADGVTYDLGLTEAVFSQSMRFENLKLLPPEDVLLIKALLQRGEDVGKHDIEDIRKFKSIYNLDTEYLRSRITYLGADARVDGVI